MLSALFVASAFGALSLVMIQAPEQIGAATILLFPGAVLGIVTVLGIVIGGNVHDFPTWAVVLGNFAFYFGVVYLVCEMWERYTARANAAQKPK